MSLFNYNFLVRGLIAAVLIGMIAPTVGIYLMQRRLSLIGDGLGHVAFTGVALGVVTGTAPVWTALIISCLGAVAVELIRANGRTSGDVALAILFYGGIASGVVIVSQSPGGARSLNAYLFGALTTTTASDLITFAVLSIGILFVTVGLRHMMFAVSNDEEFARAAGLPVTACNLILAIVTALTVVVSMRIVGLLLISALMIVPVAAAQQLARSFASTLALASVIGLTSAVTGVFVSYSADTPPGATIVLLAVVAFAVAVLARAIQNRLGRQPNR